MSGTVFDAAWAIRCGKWLLGTGIVAGVAAWQLTRTDDRSLWQIWLAVMMISGVLFVGALGALSFAWHKPKHVRLGSILRYRYRLSNEILNEIAMQAQAQGKRLGEMAVELSYVTPEELEAALREQAAMNAAAA